MCWIAKIIGKRVSSFAAITIEQNPFAPMGIAVIFKQGSVSNPEIPNQNIPIDHRYAFDGT
jgi:hypothetical protein